MFIYMCNIISFSFMGILLVKLLLLLKHANIMSIITLLYLGFRTTYKMSSQF